MLHGWKLKAVLFFAAWYEVMAEMHLDGDTAFIVTAFAMFVGWLALRMRGELAAMLGPLTTGLLLRAGLWLLLLWWLSPSWLGGQPIVFQVIGFGMLVFAGGRARREFEARRTLLTKAELRKHSEWVLFVALGLPALAAMAWHAFGSAFVLLGYALLPGIPLQFGWQAAITARKTHTDARMGTDDSFREAGVSEER